MFSTRAVPPPPPLMPRPEKPERWGAAFWAATSAGLLILGAVLLGLAYGPGVLAEWLPPRGQAVAPTLAALRDKVSGDIAQVRTQSRELPPCPLVYPLLAPKGGVTPLGSYLSYLGMKRASYLPMAVWRLPNAGEIFNDFGLFSARHLPVQDLHRQELPFRFMARDFAEGTILETRTGYDLTLHLWGTRPDQRLGASFTRSQFHRAPEWIAASLHAWMGFQPDEAQKAYLKAPCFTCPEDLLRAAKVECLFRVSPDLVNRWDEILARNPDHALMYDRWLSMAYSRGYATTTEMLDPRLRKAPQDAMLRMNVERANIRAKHFQKAWELVLEDVRADDNNSLHYQMAAEVLGRMDCHGEAVKLLEVWRDKHPENQEAWMELAKAHQEHAWQARGTGYAGSVTAEGWRLMKERMQEAVKAAQQATLIAPRDCRVWATLLGTGTGASFSKQRMEGLFHQVVALNPFHLKAYSSYLNYLQPKWFGSEEEAHAFVDAYQDRFPLLTCELLEEDFWDRGPRQGEAQERAHYAREADKVRTSPYLGLYEQRMQAHLRTCPYDSLRWRDYAFWLVKIGKRDQVLAFAREVLAGADPEWASVYPGVLETCLAMERNQVVGAAEKEAFEHRPDVMRLSQEVFHGLLEADPNNWLALNRLAKFQADHGQWPEAAATFARIGPNWTPWAWGRPAFDQAKAKARSVSK